MEIIIKRIEIEKNIQFCEKFKKDTQDGNNNNGYRIDTSSGKHSRNV